MVHLISVLSVAVFLRFINATGKLESSVECEPTMMPCYNEERTRIVDCYREDELCCAGLVRKVPTISSLQCCSGARKFYNTKNQLCCGSHIIDAPSYKSLKCCGITTYDDLTQICCYGNIFPRFSSSKEHENDVIPLQHECCGADNVYVEGDKECCMDLSQPESATFCESGYQCCAGQCYRNTTHICHTTTERVWLVEAICGSAPYDPTKSICCAGHLNATISELSPNSKCCGKIAYNNYFAICCDNEVLPRTDENGFHNARCCRGESYDEATKLCCNGRIIPKEDRDTLKCCELAEDGYIDYKEFMCCNGKPHPRTGRSADESCCGQDQYNKTGVYQCCGGQLIYKNKTCCAETPLEVGYICCNESGPVKKEDPGHDACCHCRYPSRNRLYNSNTEECHSCTVMVKDPSLSICGNSYFDPEESICCVGTVVDNPTRSMHCCDGEKYDDRIQICFFDYIKESYHLYNVGLQDIPNSDIMVKKKKVPTATLR